MNAYKRIYCINLSILIIFHFLLLKCCVKKIISTINKQMAKTEELLSSGHQAPKLGLITFIWLNLMCTYRYNHVCTFFLLFAHSSAHPYLYFHMLPLIFFSYFYFILTYIYIYSLVLCFIFILIFLHCPLSGPVLIYISLLIISCIIEYVTNKRTLTLTKYIFYYFNVLKQLHCLILVETMILFSGCFEKC